MYAFFDGCIKSFGNIENMIYNKNVKRDKILRKQLTRGKYACDTFDRQTELYKFFLYNK